RSSEPLRPRRFWGSIPPPSSSRSPPVTASSVLPVVRGDEEVVAARLLGAAELPGRAREVADEHGPVGARGAAGLVGGGLADVRQDEPRGAGEAPEGVHGADGAVRASCPAMTGRGGP